MRGKWVDNSSYFGPDRRKSGGSKRWGDKRRVDEAGDLAPLGALLRRLRLHVTNLRTEDERKHALQVARAAIAQADAQGLRSCADVLQDAARMIAVANDAKAIAAADARVLEAMALVDKR